MEKVINENDVIKRLSDAGDIEAAECIQNLQELVDKLSVQNTELIDDLKELRAILTCV